MTSRPLAPAASTAIVAPRRLTGSLPGLLLALALAGCQTAPEAQPPAAAGPAKAATAVVKAPASAPVHQGHGGAGHECSPEVPASQAAPKLALRGGDSLAVGQKLAGLPVVTVAQLAKRPAAYAGKTVRVEGKVNTLCHHRRGWFGVRDAAAPEGPAIRVITAPAFLVPENAIGRTAKTEGVVELVEVKAETARYFAKSHGMGNPEAYKSEQPVKQVIIKATGAEFR